MKFPLSLRVFILLALNVSLAAFLLIWIAAKFYSVGWNQLTRGGAEPRLVSMAGLVTAGLDEVARDDWAKVLEEFEKAYHVDLGLYRPYDEQFIEGTQWDLSEETKTVFRRGVPAPRSDDGPPPRRSEDFETGEIGKERPPPRRLGDGPRPPRGFRDESGPEGRRGPPGRGGPPENRNRPGDLVENGDFERPREERAPPLQSEDTERRDLYFIRLIHSEAGEVGAVAVEIANRIRPNRNKAILLIRERDGCELFFSWQPMVWGLAGVLSLSLLIWVPWIYRVTRRLGILTRGAESISRGYFDVAVATNRTDEIGRLSRSLQSMAGKLDDFVSGQKRFLGDIAHELCSPLVRIRMGLGVLEHKLESEDFKKLESVNGEVEELSLLVNELLDFSKASLKPKSLKMELIKVGDLCGEVIRREKGEAQIAFSAPLGLKIETNRDLFKRAMGNVVRNAVKYAEDVKVNVTARKGAVQIAIEDRGPGLPDEWIDRIFEPFARPDGARTRESGGAGLGMAISKTCIESIGGSVSCVNREGGGLSVVFTVPG